MQTLGTASSPCYSPFSTARCSTACTCPRTRAATQIRVGGRCSSGRADAAPAHTDCSHVVTGLRDVHVTPPAPPRWCRLRARRRARPAAALRLRAAAARAAGAAAAAAGGVCGGTRARAPRRSGRATARAAGVAAFGARLGGSRMPQTGARVHDCPDMRGSCGVCARGPCGTRPSTVQPSNWLALMQKHAVVPPIVWHLQGLGQRSYIRKRTFPVLCRVNLCTCWISTISQPPAPSTRRSSCQPVFRGLRRRRRTSARATIASPNLWHTTWRHSRHAAAWPCRSALRRRACSRTPSSREVSTDSSDRGVQAAMRPATLGRVARPAAFW